MFTTTTTRILTAIVAVAVLTVALVSGIAPTTGVAAVDNFTQSGSVHAAASTCHGPVYNSVDYLDYEPASGTCDGDGFLRGRIIDDDTNNRCAYVVVQTRVSFLGNEGDAVSYEARECSERNWEWFLIDTREIEKSVAVYYWAIHLCDGKVPTSVDETGMIQGDFRRCKQIEVSWSSGI